MSETQVEVPDVKQESAEVASEPKQPIDQVPYARFKELVDEKNTMKTEYESLKNKIKGESEARQLKEMESKGEYDKIMADMNARLETLRRNLKHGMNIRQHAEMRYYRNCLKMIVLFMMGFLWINWNSM